VALMVCSSEGRLNETLPVFLRLNHCETMYRSPHDVGPPCENRGVNPAVAARLAEVLRGKRLACVGDSLTRQWFETLSCAMNLTTVWYAAGTTAHGLAAERAGALDFCWTP